MPFTVNASAQFNVSWYETCQASGPVGTYTITSVSSVYDIPFSIVGSNVPVTLQWGNYSWSNVTLQAPNYAWSGQLFVFITANWRPGREPRSASKRRLNSDRIHVSCRGGQRGPTQARRAGKSPIADLSPSRCLAVRVCFSAAVYHR